MNQQDLFAAIGAVDDMCLQRCDSYRPSHRWENIAKHAAVFVTVVLVIFFAAYLLVPDVQAFFDGKAQHQKTYDYIQLPPELTTWSLEDADGFTVSGAGVVRGDTFYMLTLEEYQQIAYENADVDEVLAAREEWAAEWKDYVPSFPEQPSDNGSVVIE